MQFSKKQRAGLHIVVTAEDLTPAQIREAADRWPQWISSERSATALGLPESHTSGGLPLYPPLAEMHHAREAIAGIISAHHADPSNEHATEWDAKAPLASSRCAYETHPCRDPACARCGAQEAK